MIHVTSWNDGYETHDTKRKSGQLMWVRQNILMNDVRWAKLWMRKDAAQVWAGWTAIVWCAAHSADRGAIEGAEDVSILSRVPLEMVKLALEWGFSCGFIESRQNPDDSATEARQNPDEIPQTPEITATTGRDGTGQDDTGRDNPPKPPKGHGLAKAEELYQAYPKRISKAAALKAIVSAMKVAPFETLMDAVTEYAKAINATTKPEDMQFIPAAGPWFNAGRWEDDRSAWWNGKRPEQKLEQKFVPFEAKPKLTRAMMSPDLWHLYPEIEE